MALLSSSLLRWLRASAVLLAMAAPAAGLAQPVSAEREVQAVFLLNLTRFVRWPEQAFQAEEAPLVIGMLQNDPLAAVVEEGARGESSGKHPIVIRRVGNANDLDGCHVVYFPRQQMEEAVRWLPGLRGKPVLTVSDGDGFLPLGGHVQMFSRGGQLKLRLDADNLKRGELTASSQLLRVAEVIGGDRTRRRGALQLPLQQRLVDGDGGLGAFRGGHDREVHAAADIARDVEPGNAGGGVRDADHGFGGVELTAERFG